MVSERVAKGVLPLLAALLAASAGMLAGPAVALPGSPTDRELERARQAEGEAASAIAQAEARLAAANERFDELMLSAARATEAHNGAQYALEQARVAESEAAAEATRDERAADRARTELGRVAATAYRTGGQLRVLAAVLDADRSDQFVDGTVVLQTAARSQGTIADRALEAAAKAQGAAQRALQARLDREEVAETAKLASEQAAAAVLEFESQMAALEREREQALVELAEARGTTAELQERRQAALAMEAALEAEQAAAASSSEPEDSGAGRAPQDDAATPTEAPASEPPGDARGASSPQDTTPSPDATRDAEPSPSPSSPSPTARPSSPSPPPPSPSPPTTSSPPPPSGAQLAIDYARAQLGKPYEWGGAGPDTFDCSGLTMRAWERAGVSLPHWSVAQARMVTRVSYADLMPGDLIFWSDNGQATGVYHVGLYIGSGKMIHAPRTGKVVEIQSVFYWLPPSFYGRV